ncbi:MAG: aminoglycoside phosphotransferase family protein [Methylococcales bacterium]|nr:aminoglycoside phosphotransferase family protein [Methylococcales bacterium]MDP3838568.1 aminoglycoside phosphotransferase family protein [Methylococcales bacterium]
MPYSVAQQFTAAITDITPLGNGLINDTFLVTCPASTFVLQRINKQVFPAPEQIMRNLHQLNQHIQQKPSAAVKLQIPDVLKTITEQDFFRDENGDVWRALSFITDSESINTLDNLEIAAQVGFALGHFHCLVSDLNPEYLHDTLPSFHIAPDYLHQYQQVLTQTTVFPENIYCAEFIAQYQHITSDLETAKHQGLLTLRITHGDPKLDNFLFDKHSGTVISLIDLDTVKPALVHYDIGDCLRSCCQTAAGEFDMAVCEVILKNYLHEVRAFFTDHDYAYLYPAIRLIPFELGLRFYTDYLQGNCYFKVTDDQQNLHRAIAQFNLCASVMQQETIIKQLIAQLND